MALDSTTRVGAYELIHKLGKVMMRQMRSGNLLTLLTLSLTTLAVGCAEPPTASTEAAKGRLAAVATEATTYAPDAYGTAEEAVARLDAELETQAGRFALSRSYERSGELIASVNVAVDAVEEAIEVEKQRLRTEAAQLVTAGERAVIDAHNSIAAISSDDLPAEQASSWESGLTSVETSLTEVGRLLAGNQLIEANREADSALNAATGINTAVTAFVTEFERANAEEAARRARGYVTIPWAVLANGQRLAAGTYLLRLAEDGPASSGTGPGGRWVEFVDAETVTGRGLAIVIPDSEIGEVADSAPPRNEARVVALKGGDYVRVWLNRNSVNYLVHMPPA